VNRTTLFQRGALALVALATLSLAHACTYDSSGLGSVSCTEEGARVGGAVCRDGVLVVAADGGVTPDAGPDDADPPLDVGPDVPNPDDVGPDADADCVETLTPAEACGGPGAECGPITVEGRCGPVTLNCNDLDPCDDGDSCVDNTCTCVPETPFEFCQRAGVSCGLVTAEDNCGNTRVDIGCGTCPPAGDPTRATCSDETNTCVCTPETDAEICGRLGKQCGVLDVDDNCGATRSVDCDVAVGGCSNGACLANNTCEICQPETDANFCVRLGAECGLLSAADNCGDMRTDVDCTTERNACTADEVCDDPTKQCVCPEPVCPGTAECGSVSNQCGRTTVCGPAGGCGVDQVCDAGTLTCECGPAVCPAGANCGTFTNSCGSMASCGPDTCTSGETCSNNVCVCDPEDDAAFCARQGAECGLASGADNCNIMRTDVDCTAATGACTDDRVCNASNTCACPLPTCAPGACGTISNACGSTNDCDAVNGGCTGPGEVCTDNACVCTPEDDAAFCARQSAECGLATGMDNCGNTRTDVDCDAAVGCPANETCNGNTCSCTPESDADFCARQGAECGLASGTDNCGATRTNVDCNAVLLGCTLPEICLNNTCGCVPEDDATVCSKSGAECGLLTTTDNCGATRTDVDCDAAVGGCAANETCTNNTCACVPESDADFCARQSAECGLASGMDNCGATRTDVDCDAAAGGCTAPETCVSGTCQACTPDPDTKLCSDNSAACGEIVVTDNCGTTRAIDCDAATGGGCTSPQVCDANACENEIRLQAPNRTDDDRFGNSVDVAGSLIVVGAPYEDTGATNAGMVYVYERAGDGSVSLVQQLQASDRDDSDGFGWSVATDGDTIVVGARDAQFSSTDSGAAYVFERSGMTWTQVAKVGPTGAQSGAYFGFSVDVDGDTVVVGEPLSDRGNSNNGAIYVFERTNGSWGPTSGAPLTHTNTNGGDFLGADVEVDEALGYVYAGASGDCNGRIAIFHKPAASWTELDLITHDGSGCGSGDDLLGRSFATQNGVIFGGAQEDDTGGNDRGSVHVFYTSGAWGSSDEITTPDSGADDDGFGYRLAVDGTKMAVVASRDIDGRGDRPRLYIGTTSTSSPFTFTTTDSNGNEEGNASDEFGYSVAISQEIVVVGRPGHNTDRGSVYIYETE
jgi:hypothetical protein